MVTTVLAGPAMVDWSGILARKISRWFLNNGKSAEFSFFKEFWEEIKPGTMNIQEPLPGTFHINGGIIWDVGRDTQPAPPVTPMPFDLKSLDHPLRELLQEADLEALPPVLNRSFL